MQMTAWNHKRFYNTLMNVLLFDIDGTLIRSGGAGKAAMEEALRSEFGVREILDRRPVQRPHRSCDLPRLTAHSRG